jgi:hypothetical protein
MSITLRSATSLKRRNLSTGKRSARILQVSYFSQKSQDKIFEKITSIHESFAPSEPESPLFTGKKTECLDSEDIGSILQEEKSCKNFQSLKIYSESWQDRLKGFSNISKKKLDLGKAREIQEEFLTSCENLVGRQPEIFRKIELGFKNSCVRLLAKMKNCATAQYNIEKQLENNSFLIEKLISNLSNVIFSSGIRDRNRISRLLG